MWQLFPEGTLYKPYVADPKEPRFSSVWLYEVGVGWVWEGAMGGRFPVARYGSGDTGLVEGWQIELEAGGFVRLDVGTGGRMEAVDFKGGVVATRRSEGTALKVGFTHLSSHVGDEFLARNPGFQRRDYVRDSLVAGVRQRLIESTTVYGEIGYAVGTRGGAEPFEFRLGAEYGALAPSDWRGTPFAAIDVHLRQEFAFDGDVNALVGWQWSPVEPQRVMRLGIQYYNGHALQFQFFDEHEEFVGAGIWFDF